MRVRAPPPAPVTEGLLSEYRSTCPRCSTTNQSFDLLAQNYLSKQYNWKRWYEIYCVCRSCHKGTIFLVSQQKVDDHFPDKPMPSYKGYVNDVVDHEGYVSLKDQGVRAPPEHLEGEVAIAFREAETSRAVGCWNAAGAMYRSCVDLTTKALMPAEADPPDARTRRSMGLRLKWLFDNGKLPPELQPLSSCIQQDGNDAAHDVALTEIDAEDLADFTFQLLERLFTIPQRLLEAEKRRLARRASPGS